MDRNLIIKNIIASLFLLCSLFIFGLKLFDLLFGGPSKISNEPFLFSSSIIFSTALIILFLTLAFGLYYSRKWSFVLYNMLLVLWLIIVSINLFQTNVKTLLGDVIENILLIIFFVVIPIVLDIFLYKIKDKYLIK